MAVPKFTTATDAIKAAAEATKDNNLLVRVDTVSNLAGSILIANALNELSMELAYHRK